MKKYLEQEQQFTEYVHNKDFDSAVRNWLGMSKDEPITEGIYEGIRKRVGINTKNPVNSAGGPNIGRYQATTPLERFLQSTGKPLQRVPQSTGQTGVLSLGNKGESVDVPIIRGTKGMEGVDKFIDDLVASTNTKSAGSTESRAAQAGKGDVVDAQSNLTEPKNSGMLTAYMRTFAKRQGNPFKK